MQTLRDQACIGGVGETAYTRGAQKSVLRLVLEAWRHMPRESCAACGSFNWRLGTLQRQGPGV